MSDLLIIVTRMTGTEGNEFVKYFGRGNQWAVVYKNGETKMKIIAQDLELSYDKKIIVVYGDGMGVQNNNNIQNSLCCFLNNAINDRREILILLHPGVDLTIGDAKTRIFCAANHQNNRVAENETITIAQYSSTQNAIYQKVGMLAAAIRNNGEGNGNIDEYITELTNYIKKNTYKPCPKHLIALSILCQGYLAAHGQTKELTGWEKVPDEFKEKVKSKADNTEKKSWWTSALGNDEFKIQDELKAVPDDKDNKKKDVQDLITAIYTNGDALPDGNLVAKAYSALKSILK